MQFGLLLANIGPHASGEGARRLAVAAEEAGFESIWAVEHVVVPAGYRSEYPYDQSGKMPGGREDFDLPDPLIWLAWAGSATQRINLGTGVVILPQRNPVVLAKEVATLDSLCGGRVRLGVGVGWLAEEFDRARCPLRPPRGPHRRLPRPPCRRCGHRTSPPTRAPSPASIGCTADPSRPGRGPRRGRGRSPRPPGGPAGSATGSFPARADPPRWPSCSTSCGAAPRRRDATPPPSSSPRGASPRPATSSACRPWASPA